MNIQTQIHGNIAGLARDAVGAGLKPQHYAEILAARPDIGFFEIHAENFMSAGGPPHRWLAAIAEIYPLSVHGVGLSLGSAEPLDPDRLARLARVVALYLPVLVSEHLAWCDFSGRAFPDLLPLPYDEANLRRIADKIDATQTALGRAILLENPATYLRYAGDAFAEPQFLDELASRSGCGLLLDVNNVHVSAVNHGFDAEQYLDAFPLERVGEIHLAGFAEAQDARGAFLIDDHGGLVSEAVWALYADVLRRAGPRPTLIEWDNNVPEWSELFAETRRVRQPSGASADAGSPSPLAGEGGVEPRMRGLFASDAPSSDRSDQLSPQGEKGSAAPRADWLAGQSAFTAALDNPALPAPDLFADSDAAARFAVYRNNSAVAAVGALKEQFPTVVLLVGEEAFAGLAREFARRCPPRTPTLAEYGAEFPGFVARFLAEYGAQAQTPYLPDVARLDWARLAALRAPEAAPCPREKLGELDPDRLAELRLVAHPSLILVASDWPILAIARAHEQAIQDWRGETVLVLRPQAELVCVALPPGVAAFLRACLDGETLAPAAQAAMEADENFDFGRTLVELTEIGAVADFAQT
jgi:uncharacterized protein (UPF0276 family)